MYDQKHNETRTSYARGCPPPLLRAPQVTEQQLTQQLEQFTKGDTWLVYVDTDAANDGSSSSSIAPRPSTLSSLTSASSSKGPAYYTNLGAFKDYVQQQYLVGVVPVPPRCLGCSTAGVLPPAWGGRG